MSYTIDVQVLSNGEPYANALVRLSIGKTFPGGRHGIYGDSAWTDEDGHTTFEAPEYSSYTNKYVNFEIGGTWYGSWDLDQGGGFIVDVATDTEADEDDDDDEDEDED